MRAYWALSRRAFRRYSTYRGATVGGLLTNTAFGFMRGYVLLALYRSRPNAGGWDATDAITYIWLTQAILMTVAMWGWNELGDRVRTGSIATDLVRPLDIQWGLLAEDYGRAAYQLLARGVVPLATGAVFFDLRIPQDPRIWLAFLASLAIGTGVSFGVRFIANAAAFWIIETRGINIAYSIAVNLLSGFIIPVVLFPGWLRSLSRFLPFASVIQTPIEVFLGKHGVFPIGTLAVQALWLVALLGLGRLVLRAGTRHLVVQGG